MLDWHSFQVCDPLEIKLFFIIKYLVTSTLLHPCQSNVKNIFCHYMACWPYFIKY